MKKLLLIIVLTLAVSGFGQNTTSVSVDVQSKDKQLNETIESYITREIRSLGDVEILKDGAFYSLSIIVLENTIGGRKVGYTLSTVVRWRANCQAAITKEIFPCYVFDDHIVDIGPTDGLRKLCEEIITNFDTRSVKPLRKK